MLLALLLYGAALAVSRLVRAALAIVATLLLLSYLLNPSEPWALVQQVGATALPALRALARVGWALLQTLIGLVLRTIGL